MPRDPHCPKLTWAQVREIPIIALVGIVLTIVGLVLVLKLLFTKKKSSERDAEEISAESGGVKFPSGQRDSAGLVAYRTLESAIVFPYTLCE